MQSHIDQKNILKSTRDHYAFELFKTALQSLIPNKIFQIAFHSENLRAENPCRKTDFPVRRAREPMRTHVNMWANAAAFCRKIPKGDEHAHMLRSGICICKDRRLAASVANTCAWQACMHATTTTTRSLSSHSCRTQPKALFLS